MEKLIRGIVEFRRHVRPDYRETFARLALEQAPDTLFIACSDSRVVPNLFASADPGDLFVIRNVGNLIAPAGKDGISQSDESEAAAVEFALASLHVQDVIICGHSECGAMQALTGDRRKVQPSHLRSWLRHGEGALKQLTEGRSLNKSLSRHNQLSQLNVLAQLEHLKTYPIVRERLQAKALRLHAWWFELKNADVFAYDEASRRFVLIDEAAAEALIRRLHASS